MADFQYISFERRFIDIGTATDSADERVASFPRSIRGKPTGDTWEDIQKNDATIILGTAGSGKTTEVLEAAKKLRRSGTPAFVLKLEALCRQSVRQSFSPKDPDGERMFNQWLGSNRAAVLFLDALDEARLPDARNGSVLNDAFGQLGEAIGSAGQALKLVVTTRPSEWHGATDSEIVAQFLKKLRGDLQDKLKPKVGVYRLAGLQHAEVERLAESRLPSTAEFLHAVGRARAASLAQQPFEVHLLIDAWLYELEKGVPPDQVFASRLELFRSAISARLQTEQDQERRSNLDPTGARRACEKLAAATVLAGVQDLSIRPGIPLSVNALAVLSNDVEPWTEASVRQLLSSALFQPSIAGKIRFAHRELQDFQAAQFFDRQMRSNSDSLDVITPLFAESHGKTFAPPETEQVIGWLATLNKTARTEITSFRPSLLIETGDPLFLSSEERGAALEAHIALYDDRRFRGEWFASDDVTKFATPDLAPTVSRLLDSAKSPEAREFLVEVARYGEIVLLADKMVAIATDSTEALRVRAEACLALKDFGDAVRAERAFQASLYVLPPDDVQEAPTWNRYQVSALQCAFPHSVNVLDAICAISRLRREASNYASITPQLLEELGSSIADDDVGHWLMISLRFASGARQEGQSQLPTVVAQYRILKALVLGLSIRLLRSGNWRHHQPAMLDAIEYLSNRGDHFSMERSKYDELLELMVPNIELKKALIDRRVGFFPARADGYVRVHGVIEGIKLGDKESQRSVFSIDDVVTQLRGLRPDRSPLVRRTAFEIAYEIIYRLPLKERQEGIRMLEQAVRKSGDTELQRRFPRGVVRWFQARWYRFRHQSQYQLRTWFRKKRDSVLDLYWRVRNTITFFQRRKNLQSGVDQAALTWTFRQKPNDLGDETVVFIKQRYGSFISDWFSTGYRAFWRQHSLTKNERNSYLLYAGLAGLAIDAKRGPIVGTEQEIANTLVYGLLNPNNVPQWFVETAEANRAVFKDVAQREILEEWATDASDNPNPSDVLRKVIDADPALRDEITPFLLEQLKAGVDVSSANVEFLTCHG